jgi:hypothetical protein
MELRVESALACPRRKIWEKRTVPTPIVEPTCAAFGTTKKQPRASNGGKAKERQIPLLLTTGMVFRAKCLVPTKFIRERKKKPRPGDLAHSKAMSCAFLFLPQ